MGKAKNERTSQPLLKVIAGFSLIHLLAKIHPWRTTNSLYKETARSNPRTFTTTNPVDKDYSSSRFCDRPFHGRWSFFVNLTGETASSLQKLPPASQEMVPLESLSEGLENTLGPRGRWHYVYGFNGVLGGFEEVLTSTPLMRHSERCVLARVHTDIGSRKYRPQYRPQHVYARRKTCKIHDFCAVDIAVGTYLCGR